MSVQSTTVETEVEWRDVPTYIGLRASSLGEVQTRWVQGRSRGGTVRGKNPATLGDKWRTVPFHVDRDGYLKTVIPPPASPNGKRVEKGIHILVCLAFHGLPQPGQQVAHFPDRDPTNNRPENLGWYTCKENQSHRKIHGTGPNGERNGRSILNDKMVRRIRRLSAKGLSRQKIADRMGLQKHLVTRVVTRESWNHVI